MNKWTSDNIMVWCLRLGACLCFAGWGWAHLYWEESYGPLLWHDRTWELAESLGIDWDSFVGTGANGGWLQVWIRRVSWMYPVCAIVSLTARRQSWFQLTALLAGSVMLGLISFVRYLAVQQQLPMLVEHGGQILMPVLLVVALVAGVQHRLTMLVALVALLTTFAGHGCYALGLWPTPSGFHAMTSVILGLSYDAADRFVRCGGALDMLVCVAVWVPGLRRAAVLYASIWGLTTALARPVAGMSTGLIYWGADQFVHEAVLRAPHFLIPLYLWLLWTVDFRKHSSRTRSPILNSPRDTGSD